MVIKRKLKSLDNKTGEKIKTAINEVLKNSEKYKKCYFWSNTGSASSRRREEFDNRLIFTLKGRKYKVFQSLDISCKNFYFATSVEIDGNRSNIRALKSLV